MNKTLTAKQERFCVEYLVDGNAAAAARRAGYSEKTAESYGCKLLKLPAVAKKIKILNQSIASKRIADAEEVMAALTAIVRRETCDWVVVDKQPVEVAPKLSDVIKAAELLGKRYAVNTPVVIVDDVGGVTPPEIGDFDPLIRGLLK